MEDRVINCERCGRPEWDNSKRGNRKYCSDCSRLMHNRHTADRDPKRHLAKSVHYRSED